MKDRLILLLRNNFGLVVLLFVSFLIYVPSLSGDFVVDDIPTIKDNPYIRDSGHIPGFFTKGVWANSALEDNTVPIYRPMHLVVELLNHTMWGSNPVGYHVFLLLLHLANACLVFILIRKLSVGSAMAATIGTAIFALHPTRVESVAWLSGITDPLVLFFLLGALLAHRSFIENRKKWWYLALSLLGFQMALWSKEVAIVLPLVVVAHDLIYKRKIHWPAVFLHIGLVIGYLVARSLALGESGKPGILDLSRFSRAVDFALGYSELVILPASVPFYLQPPEHSVSSALGVIGAVAIAALIIFSWRAFNPDRKRTLAFLLCWVIGFSWPAILMMFYMEGYYSARFLYVPTVGMAIFAAIFYEHMSTTHPGLKIPAVASSMLIVLVYGFVTWKEIPAWHDDEMVYGKIAKVSPESGNGFSRLGQFYLQRENYVAAEKNFMLALEKTRIPKDRASILVALGTIQGMSNNLILSERYLKEAIQIDPANSDAWAGLGNLSWMQGRIDEAISCYEKAIAIRPGNYEAAINLAMAYEKIGQSERGASIRQRADTIRRGAKAAL